MPGGLWGSSGGGRFLMSEVPLKFGEPTQTETVIERGGNTLKGFIYLFLKKGSSQGQHLALTVLFVPSSLLSGAITFRIREYEMGLRNPEP